MQKLLRNLYHVIFGERRAKTIVSLLQAQMPEYGSVLDLGCGDGDITRRLQRLLPLLEFTAVDLHAMPHETLSVQAYDGITIPYADQYFDYVLLVTVLHHTDDYKPLLQEVKRVAKKGVIILDHQYKTKIEWLLLALIDTPGNIPFGVYTPFNFKKRSEWEALFEELNFIEIAYNDELCLFGKLNWLFGRKMHFISQLQIN